MVIGHTGFKSNVNILTIPSPRTSPDATIITVNLFVGFLRRYHQLPTPPIALGNENDGLTHIPTATATPLGTNFVHCAPRSNRLDKIYFFKTANRRKTTANERLMSGAIVGSPSPRSNLAVNNHKYAEGI